MKIPGIKKLISLVAGVATVATMLFTSVPAYADAPTAPSIYIDPASYTQTTGSSFTVVVRANVGTAELRGFDVTVGFPAGLEVNDAELNGVDGILWDKNSQGYALKDWKNAHVGASFNKISSSLVSNPATGYTNGVRFGAMLGGAVTGGATGDFKLFTIPFVVTGNDFKGNLSSITISNQGLVNTNQPAGFFTGVSNGSARIMVGNPPNVAPVLDLVGDKTVSVGAPLTVNLTANDPDFDPFTFSKTAGNTWVTVSASGTMVINPPTGANLAGPYSFTVQVSDGIATDTETFNVIVPNAAPVLAAIGAQSVNEGATLSFNLSATDADGDVQTYSMTDAPTGATLVAGAFSYVPGYAAAGSYTVTFTATDSLATDSEAVVITVNNVNLAPALAVVVDQTVPAGSLLTFGLSGSDPDGSTGLVYSMSSVPALPAGATLTGNVFSWTPAMIEAGEYEVTFTVTDPGSLADSKTATITATSNYGSTSVSGTIIEEFRFVVPTEINWNQNSLYQKTPNTSDLQMHVGDNTANRTMLIKSNKKWNVQIKANAVASGTDGFARMTKFDTTTGTYDSANKLINPLVITGENVVNPKVGIDTLLTDGIATDLVTGHSFGDGSTIANGNERTAPVNFLQHVEYADPALAANCYYNMVVTFTCNVIDY